MITLGVSRIKASKESTQASKANNHQDGTMRSLLVLMIPKIWKTWMKWITRNTDDRQFGVLVPCHWMELYPVFQQRFSHSIRIMIMTKCVSFSSSTLSSSKRALLAAVYTGDSNEGTRLPHHLFRITLYPITPRLLSWASSRRRVFRTRPVEWTRFSIPIDL